MTNFEFWPHFLRILDPRLLCYRVITWRLAIPNERFEYCFCFSCCEKCGTRKSGTDDSESTPKRRGGNVYSRTTNSWRRVCFPPATLNYNDDNSICINHKIRPLSTGITLRLVLLLCGCGLMCLQFLCLHLKKISFLLL